MLQEYDLIIKHVRGYENVIADTSTKLKQGLKPVHKITLDKMHYLHECVYCIAGKMCNRPVFLVFSYLPLL